MPEIIDPIDEFGSINEGGAGSVVDDGVDVVVVVDSVSENVGAKRTKKHKFRIRTVWMRQELFSTPLHFSRLGLN